MYSCRLLKAQSQVVVAVCEREAVDVKKRSENALISNKPMWTIKPAVMKHGVVICRLFIVDR